MLFGELLQKFIDDRKINITTLAKESGIDRTLIQRYISGERTPVSRDKLEMIIRPLMLNVIQYNEVVEAYNLKNTVETRWRHLCSLIS